MRPKTPHLRAKRAEHAAWVLGAVAVGDEVDFDYSPPQTNKGMACAWSDVLAVTEKRVKVKCAGSIEERWVSSYLVRAIRKPNGAIMRPMPSNLTRVEILLTADEKAAIAERAGDESLSNYFRALAGLPPLRRGAPQGNVNNPYGRRGKVQDDEETREG